MSTAERYRVLRTGYYRRIELGMAVAFGVHAVVFAVAPPYVPRPFRLPHNEPLRLVQAGPVRLGAVAPAEEIAQPALLPQQPAIVRSEQLETVPNASAPQGAAGPPGAAGVPGATGAGAGTGDAEAPPVFYAYDTAPRAVRRVEPEYPLAARIIGAEGTVVVNVNIDESGRIMRAWVAQASAPEALVEAALDAVYRFEFLPGKQGPFPVKCTVAIPFRFSLKRI